jgi:hypothetical protein
VHVIPIDGTDNPAERKLRAELARFWLTERDYPRAVYDRAFDSACEFLSGHLDHRI